MILSRSFEFSWKYIERFHEEIAKWKWKVKWDWR